MRTTRICLLLLLLPLGAAAEPIFTESFEGGFKSGVEECREIPGFKRAPYALVINHGFIARSYEDLFGAWGASGNTLWVQLGADQFMSMPMTIGPDRADDATVLLWERLQTSPNRIRVSVSRCSGPPTPESAVPQTGDDSCYLQTTGALGGFSMTVNSGGPSIECVLEPGEYYFNWAFIDNDDSSGCDGSACTWLVKAN